MYQVVELCGSTEPWWFFEDWKDDIIGHQTFENFDEALAAYKSKWWRLKVGYPSFRSRASLLSAFWDKDNQIWCEECGEDLHEYTSLALLQDWEELPSIYHQEQFEQGEECSNKTCSLKKIG